VIEQQEGLVHLPPEQQKMRGFQIYTHEGSCFIARFDPKYEDPEVGEIYGKLTVIGRPQTSREEVRLEGIGSIPQVGSRLMVRDVPEQTYAMNGETIKVFPYEVISRVVEFEIPKTP